MQSIASFIRAPSRLSSEGVLCCFRAATWMIFAGAMSASALAQVPAETAAAEKTEAASEPQKAAAPDTASHSDSDAPASWNRRRPAPSGVDGQLQRLTADLKLDSAQQAKIRPILVTRNEEMQRLQHDTKQTPTLRRQQALAIGDRSADQIRAQLTEAQRAQYIQPRATTVAQATPARRRGGVTQPPVTTPTNGGTK